MNYVEVLPISEYKDALHDRLAEHELSTGVLYNAVFTLKEHKERAIRFNALLSRLESPGVFVQLSPVDADLKPLGWMIYTDMDDGVLKVSATRSAGLAYTNRRTGRRETAMLHTGLLRGYQDDLDSPFLLEISSKEDMLVAG